jgi:DNA-binding beta-propeller fold protein YncE/cytochrome c peroxidase
MSYRRQIALILILSLLVFGARQVSRAGSPESGSEIGSSVTVAKNDGDRSPVDLALTKDGLLAVTANQTSDSVSLIRVADGAVLDEVRVSRRPAAVIFSPDERLVLVTTTHGGELVILERSGERLIMSGTVVLGFRPHGIAVSPDGLLAYIALEGANEVAVVELTSHEVLSRISVGKWPRYLCLTPDGSRLAVGCSGDGGVWVVDTAKREKAFSTKFVGLNIGQLAASNDGKYAYFPWMVYADRPITKRNIQEGWVLGNRLARVKLDEFARREAIALDPRGKAVADPHGMALSPNGEWAALTASGTHELVLLRISALELRTDGPGDHIKPELEADADGFIRIPLGGRPMAVRFDAAGERVLVANYLTSTIQVVHLGDRKIEREIALGAAEQPSVARRGEAIFFDAHRSVDGWYSCHSCHYEGHTNAVTIDTRNDMSDNTFKMVLTLRNIQHTGPWFWHGWQKNLEEAVERSLIETMQGPKPTEADVLELVAFLKTLEGDRGERPIADAVAVERGRNVFESEVANCASCHIRPSYTDGEIHDVGLGSEYDNFEGYNTPTLLGIANRVGYLHHGRARSLDDLLTDLHSPAKVSGTRELTDQERADLIAFLETL